MATKYFFVHNGLTVGSLQVDAATGNLTTAGTLASTSTQASTSTNTGALVVSGGAGIGGALNVGSGSTISNSGQNALFVQADGTYSGAGGGQIRISGKTNTNLRLEIGYNTSASEGFVQSYANLGSLTTFIINPDGGTVQLGGYVNSATQIVIIPAKTEATNTTSGALQITGGLGVGGNLWATKLRQTAAEVAIGNFAGNSGQGQYGVAVGSGAGQASQSQYAVAVGGTAGLQTQGERAVAIGFQAGYYQQGIYAVAIGYGAGSGVVSNIKQGNNAVAIGALAGYTSQAANSIALNATGVELNPGNSGFYVSPIRADATSSATTWAIYYNPNTKELTTSTAGSTTSISPYSGIFTSTNATSATSTITGALTVAGGVGIGGDLYVGGNIVAQQLTIQYTTVTTTFVKTDDIISTYNTTASTGTTTGALTVSGGVGIGGNLNVGGTLSVNGISVLTTASLGLYGTVFTRLTSNTTLAQNYNYIADTTAGAFSVTLPASPAVGTWVKIVDGGDWSVNNLTVLSNGSNIEGVVQDVQIDAAGIELLFVFDGTTNGWQVSTTLGQQGYTGSQGQGLQLSGTTSSNALLPGSASTGSAYLISTSTHIWVWNGSSWIDNGSLAGYVGSQGTTGYTGSASTVVGPQGAIGYAGSAGTIGYTGSSAAGSSTITNSTSTTSTGYLTFVTTTSGAANVFVDSIGGPTYKPSTDVFTVPGTFIQANLPLVVNDFSNQFDGKKAVFNLRVDQAAITNTIVDSKNVEVIVNGRRLAPYVTEQRYPWITPYDSYKGFRIKNNQVIIYNPPDIGSQAVVTIVNSSATKQTRKYPYSATTIALGD